MANDKELLEMAHELYKRLGGVGSKDARIVRALWERWQLERKLTKRASDVATCSCKLDSWAKSDMHAESCALFNSQRA